jgi:hypothetical protein
MSALGGKADMKRATPGLSLACQTFGTIFSVGPVREVVMYPHRPTVFSAALIFAMILAWGASAETTDRIKATAMEKMMPADKAAKMRECEKRAAEQKIKMEDRSRFVDECVWRKTK